MNLQTQVILADMPTRIRSYVVRCNGDTYTIVLNSKLSYEQNVVSYKHELQHIANNDFNKTNNVNFIEIHAHE